MKRPALAVLAGALAIALVAAGCGGSSDSTESTASLTKAEFVKKGNAICAKGNKNIESEFESFAKEHKLSQNKEPSDAVQEEAANEIVIPQISNQVTEIRALGTPQGDEGELEELLEKVEETLEKVEEDPSLLFGNESTFKEVNTMSREYGLTVCGEEEGE